MSDGRSTAWWRESAHEFGPRIMDSTLRGQTNWDQVLANGRRELERVISKTGMREGKDLSVLEIGCGMGRVTFALAERYSHVLGLDVSRVLIDEAKRHNSAANVQFELAEGSTIRPSDARKWDIVFSFGVFYHLNAETIAQYVRDSFSLLRPGGQMLFDTNCVPIGLRTRIGVVVRRLLYAIGVKDWRGWPTAPGFRRHFHSIEFIRSELERAGFRVERITVETPKDTWFVAVRPEAPGSGGCI